jgi:signal transduction histidine kinase
MHTRVEAAAAEVDRMMFERVQNVLSWSRLDIMQEIRVGDVDKRLSTFLQELKTSYEGVYAEIYVLDPQGMVVSSSDPGHIGRKVETSAIWLTAAMPQGEVKALALGADLLPLSASIYDAFSTSPAGSLYAVFDWQQIQAILQTSAGENAAAALLGNTGEVLAATARWQPQKSGDAVLSAAAKPHTFKYLPNFGWQLVLTQPEHTALAPVRQMGIVFLLLLAATAVVALLAVAPMANRIAKPLATLTGFARNFIREQRQFTPPQEGPAEVRELAAAFSQMMTDLEKSRENLTRAAKLAVVGEMAAAMTHEVRTPLGILRSSAQILMREPGLSEEGREVCGFIVSETERLNRLVSTLLDSARPRPAEMQPVDLVELTGQAVAMLSTQAAKQGVTLQNMAGPATVLAHCDREQVTQVLLNLMLNAIQIIGAGGRIEVLIRQETHHAVLEIADNGPGIAPELAERVFDPFFTQRSGGVGLGLAVVRQIVLAHHGEIGVHRSPLGGALFRVRLPLEGVVSE